MAPEEEQRSRPPYASAADLSKLFERMGTIADPGSVTTEWVVSYKLAAAQPEAIVSVLKWLGVVDAKGNSSGVWNEIRVAATRQAKLEELVRTAYRDVFDRIDVAEASVEDLQGTFIQAYGSGDPGRHLTCFLALCSHAGIPTKIKARKVERGAGKARQAGAPLRLPNDQENAPLGTAVHPPAKRVAPPATRRQQSDAPAVTVSLNVEIPASWSEEQIRERLTTIRRASETSASDEA
jgi:hypothetical protein